MKERIFNFSAGPAVLPVPVLKTVEENLFNYRGTGLGVMEMSHRGAAFKEIIETTEANLRKLLDIGDDYAVLFATGGASNQFSMVPMNLLGAGYCADYIVTGSWASKALKEASRFGETKLAASSKEGGFRSIPKSYDLSENSAYVHFTSNNTIAGTQFADEPTVGDRVLVCDASSDLLHRKVDVRKYGLIYAGAQKNLGPAGVTLVILRKDLLERIPDGLPVMMDYRTYAENDSLYNTPPTFPIYVVGEVLKWIDDMGGPDAIERLNREKAGLLYDCIDGTDFYLGVAALEDRSLMNVTFRLKDESLESTFIEEATKSNLNGLKGHRSVGGIRASIYNAFPKEGVEALVSFMKQFEERHG